MSVNCFYFDPYTGVIDGLPVAENMPDLHRPGRMYPPSVQCEGEFIRLDTAKVPDIQVVGGMKRVMNASLRTVYPTHGGREFDVLSSDGVSGTFLLVSTRVSDRRVKEKSSWLNAWEGIISDSDVEVVLKSPQSALFRLTEEGQEVEVFQHNGLVHQLWFEGGRIFSVPLSRAEIVESRTWQFDSQIGQLTDSEHDTRRLQGILWGAARLLRFSAKDAAVRPELVNFLVKYVDQMAERLREEVRSILLQAGDRSAGNFVYGENIVSLEERRDGEARRKRAETDRKKQERQERDRAERLSMRGTTGGGQQNKKAKQKK